MKLSTITNKHIKLANTKTNHFPNTVNHLPLPCIQYSISAQTSNMTGRMSTKLLLESQSNDTDNKNLTDSWSHSLTHSVKMSWCDATKLQSKCLPIILPQKKCYSEWNKNILVAVQTSTPTISMTKIDYVIIIGYIVAHTL